MLVQQAIHLNIHNRRNKSDRSDSQFFTSSSIICCITQHFHLEEIKGRMKPDFSRDENGHFMHSIVGPDGRLFVKSGTRTDSFGAPI